MSRPCAVHALRGSGKLTFWKKSRFVAVPMKFVAKSVILSLVFAMLALGTQVAFCGGAQSFGWDVHEHEVCAAEHSHEPEEESPCQESCDPELKEAQLAKCDPVPGPTVSEIPSTWASLIPVTPRPVDANRSFLKSEPPDGLPDRLSRSLTGRFLV